MNIPLRFSWRNSLGRWLVLVLVLAGRSDLCGQTGRGDAADSIVAQGRALGSAPGVIVLDRASRLEREVTLGPGQSLRVVAPLSVGSATIHLAGHNTITCEAPISLDHATDLFVADGAEDISVRGCDVAVMEKAGGYLLTATRSTRVSATGNHLTNLALFNTHNEGGAGNETVGVTLTGNSTDFTREGGPIGVYLMYVKHAVVANNRFSGTGHGIEWWGGDGNLGWHGAEAVHAAGDLSITGNQCYSAGGACVWGSMGYNVTVSGNSADLCSDVCFDAEGGVRNLFTGNVAQACGNGCYSVQMEGSDVVFTGNFAFADSDAPALALFLIKHRNGNPAPHSNLTITGNTLSCGSLCTAVYTEGEGGLDLSQNTVTNGVFRFANYTNSVRIANNSMRYTVALGAQAAIQGPSLAGGHTSVIEGNTLLYEAAAPDPKSACIGQGWSDDNNTDEMRIVRNSCMGFGTGIVTETAGHNPGAPRAMWILSGNSFQGIAPDKQVMHRKTTGNETYVAEPALVP